jgi:hypothetical protein
VGMPMRVAMAMTRGAVRRRVMGMRMGMGHGLRPGPGARSSWLI